MSTTKIKALLAVFGLLVSALGMGVAVYEATRKE